MGYAPLAPSMPFFTSSRTSNAMIRKIRRALQDVAADPGIRWALDAIMIESFAFDVSLQSLQNDIRTVTAATAVSALPPRPAKIIVPGVMGAYPAAFVGRPLLIQACLAKDSDFLMGVFGDLRRAVTASKGERAPLRAAASIAFGGLGLALMGPPVLKILTSMLVADSISMVGNEGSESRFNAALGSERNILLRSSIDSLRWICTRAFSFVVVSMDIAGRNLDHFDPMKETGPTCLATCTTIIEKSAVQVGIFRLSEDALRALERIDGESGSSMRPCLIYAGVVCPDSSSSAADVESAIELVRCVVWHTHARRGIDSKF